MNKEEVLKLAKLARIGISDEEAESLTKEFDSILGYVGEVKKATSPRLRARPSPSARRGERGEVYNVMREDGEPHERGIYTERLLKEAPAREGDYVKVKQILG